MSDDEEQQIRIVKLDPGQLNKDALERNFMIIVRSSQIFIVVGVVIVAAVGYLIWKISQYPSAPDEIVNVISAILSLFLISGMLLVLMGGNNAFVTTQVSRAIGKALFAVPEIPSHRLAASDPEPELVPVPVKEPPKEETTAKQRKIRALKRDKE